VTLAYYSLCVGVLLAVGNQFRREQARVRFPTPDSVSSISHVYSAPRLRTRLLARLRRRFEK
jgi:hypothetical protein